MKLLIKQRVFSWTDTYDVYDENGNVKYFVKGEILSLGHRLHVYNAMEEEVGMVREKLFQILPVFEIVMHGEEMGRIQKKLSFLKPKYEIECRNWKVEGDFLEWNYDVEDELGPVVYITKEPLHWGDTYVLDFAREEDELLGLLVVIAIDAANCERR